MLWLIMATVCAYFVKGLCGFANTLVFTTILGFTMNNINISPLEVLLGYPTNVILAWKERKNLDRKIWLPLTALVIAGSLPGIFLLKNADAGIIKLIFGFVVVFRGGATPTPTARLLPFSLSTSGTWFPPVPMRAVSVGTGSSVSLITLSACVMS